MNDILKFIIGDLKEIKDLQKDHSVKLEQYNSHLGQHMARTEQLEERFKPIEEQAVFVRKLIKLFVGLISIAAGIASAISMFK